LVHAVPIDIRKVMSHAGPYISANLSGEAVLTIGTALADIAVHACGVIAIGPFGCMPNRLSESILNETMNHADKRATDPHNQRLRAILDHQNDLPFLAVESDGSPFPQLIDAKLDAFCLRARRLHDRMIEN
jgi:predicted nucleotide-binding protein (sugar kinase/HSP70/actin superfamily)